MSTSRSKTMLLKLLLLYTPYLLALLLCNAGFSAAENRLYSASEVRMSVRQSRRQPRGTERRRRLDSHAELDIQKRRELDGALDTLQEIWTLSTAKGSKSNVETECEKASKSKSSKSSKASSSPTSSPSKGPKSSKSKSTSKPSKSKSKSKYCQDNGNDDDDDGVTGSSKSGSGSGGSGTGSGGGGSTVANERCGSVASGSLETGLTPTTYEVELDLVVDNDIVLSNNLGAVIGGLKDHLQKEVAPGLTNCSGRRRGRRSLQGKGVENVVFGDFTLSEFVNCAVMIGSNSDSQTCLKVKGLVSAYGNVPDGFAKRLEQALLRMNLPEGIAQLVGALISSSDQPAVGEGSGSPGVAAVQGPQNRVAPDDGRLSAGAAVGIAFAALAVVLLAVFAVRRKRRQSSSRDIKPVLTVDDEDDALMAYSDMQEEPKVHVLGEEDSLMLSQGEAVEVMSVMQTDAARQHEYCSSPSCDICEQRRQSGGVQFVETATALPESLPPDATRSYVADDTVTL